MSYEWEDKEEKERATKDLFTTSIIRREEFDKRLLGRDYIADDTRYLIWSSPCRMLLDDKDEMGVSGPFEAIQGALDLHCDGGWSWLVWDVKQEIGFDVESNTYIYAPMNRWAEEFFGLGSLEKNSSARLHQFIEKATTVLKERGDL